MTLSGLSRIGGETGVLTDQDVGRVAGMWPTAGWTPKATADRQFKNIIGFLRSKGMTDAQIADAGFPEDLLAMDDSAYNAMKARLLTP